jgi:hypothetical protein
MTLDDLDDFGGYIAAEANRQPETRGTRKFLGVVWRFIFTGQV